MTPACMTADELALWQRDPYKHPVSVPCIDCPMAFAIEMRRQGCCNGEPKPMGRPIWMDPEREERRRQQREAARRYRARRAADA